MEREYENWIDILSNLSATPTQTKQALDCLITSFIKHQNHHQLVLEEHNSPSLSKLIRSLCGILRCSSDPHLLTSSSQLLAIVTHNCNNDDSYKRVWEWVPVQERVLLVLRKVMFGNDRNQLSFLKLNGPVRIIKLCAKETNSYPPQTKERLKELVVNQLLIGAVTPVPINNRDKMASLFPVLTLLKGVKYPMYHVDLADGKKAWLTDTLIKEGLGLPHSDTLLPEDGVSWIIVRGTHVTGPTAIWLQYSVDKISPAVLNMFQSLSELEFPSPPLSDPLSLGSVYAVYVKDGEERGQGGGGGKEGERRKEGEGGEREGEGGGKWYRGWLLELPTKPKSGPLFFCMDYGFTVTISDPGHVTKLPDQCRGVPPQAVPCVLGGIKPPPKSYKIHRHVAAILSNLAFEKEVNRKEIAAVGGIELLLELITSIDTEVKTNAIGALINLAHSKEMCQKLRQLGSIQVFTELCILNGNLQISKLCVDLLKNILLHDPVNCIEIFNVFNVSTKLSEWRETIRDKKEEELHEIMDQLLTAIENIKKGEMPVLSTETETQPLLTCAPFPKSLSSPWEQAPPSDVVSVKSPAAVSKATPPKEVAPVYRVLSQSQRPSYSPSSSSPLDLLSPQSGTTDITGTLLYKGRKIPSAVLKRSTYACTHLIDIRSVNILREALTGSILKAMCALGNEENGGSIYIGANDNDGIVHGIVMSRADKDTFCIEFDKSILLHLKPPFDGRYTISFLPVKGGDGQCCVIEIKIAPSLTKAVHIVVSKKKNSGGSLTESCYVSREGHSVKLSFLEVQKLVESREVKKYEQLLITITDTSNN